MRKPIDTISNFFIFTWKLKSVKETQFLNKNIIRVFNPHLRLFVHLNNFQGRVFFSLFTEMC